MLDTVYFSFSQTQFIFQSVRGMLDANSLFPYHHKPIVSHFSLYSNFHMFKNACQNGNKGLLLFDFLQVTLYFQIPFDFLDLFTLKSSGFLLNTFTSFSICLVFLFALLCIRSNVYVQWLSW